MARAKNSAGPVNLNEPQKLMADQLKQRFADIMARIHSWRDVKPEEITALGADAARLHKSLKDSGIQVRHHKYMVENRGMKPDDPSFYEHVHPVEDLLKFIENQSANDDPQDETIGDEFKFAVYSRRWGHPDTYKVIRTAAGWTFKHIHGPIATGKDGRVGGQHHTGLFDLLDHDSINYPEDLPGYMEWLWDRAALDGLSHEQTQDSLNMLADWVSVVEEKSPAGIFESFK